MKAILVAKLRGWVGEGSGGIGVLTNAPTVRPAAMLGTDPVRT